MWVPSISVLPWTFKFSPNVTDLATPKPPADVIVPVVLDVLFVVALTAKPPPMIAEPDELIVWAASAHLLDACPNTLPVAEGSKLVSTLPANDIVSSDALPKSTSSFNVTLPSTFNVVSKSTAPVEFNPPTFAYVAVKFAVIEALPVIVVVPNAAVFDTVSVPVVDIVVVVIIVNSIRSLF